MPCCRMLPASTRGQQVGGGMSEVTLEEWCPERWCQRTPNSDSLYFLLSPFDLFAYSLLCPCRTTLWMTLSPLSPGSFPGAQLLQFWKKASDREGGRKEGLVSLSLLPRRMLSPALSWCHHVTREKRLRNQEFTARGWVRWQSHGQREDRSITE